MPPWTRIDGAHRVDQRDASPLVQPERCEADLPVVVVRNLTPVDLVERRLPSQLVGIDEPVHQPGLERVGGQERPLVHQTTHLGLAQIPALGDALDDLLVEVVVKRFGHLPMRRCHRRLGVEVGRCLEVARVEHVGIGTDLVERAPDEHLVACHPDQIQRAYRHQEHLVGGRRQVVLLCSAVLEERHNRLARRLVVEHRVPDLLRLAPQQLRPGRQQDDPADAFVDGRLSQAVDHRLHRRPVPHERGEQRVRLPFGQSPRHMQHEHRVGRHRRRPRRHEEHDGQSGHRHDDRQHQEDEDELDTTLDTHVSLLVPSRPTTLPGPRRAAHPRPSATPTRRPPAPLR